MKTPLLIEVNHFIKAVGLVCIPFATIWVFLTIVKWILRVVFGILS